MTFEVMLAGGQPNSLGRTLEGVDRVLADEVEFSRIVLNNAMRVLARRDPDLERQRLLLERHARDPRKSVAANARKALGEIA